MLHRKTWGLSITFALVAVAAGTMLGLLRGERIYSGVRVAGTDLGGLTAEQAEHALAPKAIELAREQVVLGYADETLSTTFAEIGGRADVRACVRAAYQVGREGNPLQRIRDIISARRHGREIAVIYALDKGSASDYLRTLARKIDRAPVNAKLVVEEGSIRAVPEKHGVELNVEKSLERIAQAIGGGAGKADLVVETAAARITTADFRGIDGVLASYSTPYKPWERDRTHNLRIACQSVSGTLVKPGGVFGYNKVVGPRLKAYGFRDAPIFVRGEIEPGTGGGVCQVSTTVYNAALLANMKILRRSHHSRPVVYAPVGRDATVAYPSPDLKFGNTTDAPIYIIASVGKRTVDVSILGKTHDGLEVQIVAAGHRVIGAPVVEEVEEDLEPGDRVLRKPGRSGHRVSIYRIVKLHGKVARKELISNDYYRPDSRVIAVAQPAPAAEPT